MLDGKEIPACAGCKLKNHFNELSPGIYQKILKENSHLPHSLTSLRLDFGNKCNLMCPTCGIHGSSNWEKVIRELMPDHKAGMTFDWPQKYPIDQSLLTDVSEIRFSGGEPMLIDECRNLLEQLIDDEKAGDISVHYVTNATIDPTPFIPTWEKFQKVVLNLSIDGIGKTFEFLRNPARWNEVEKNIFRFLELPDNCDILIINHVSIFNFFHLPEYIRWFRDLQTKYPARTIHLKFEPVENPPYFALGSLPLDLRTKAKAWLNKEVSLQPDLDLHQFRVQLDKIASDENELHYQRKIFLTTYRRFGSFDFAEIFPEIRSAL